MTKADRILLRDYWRWAQVTPRDQLVEITMSIEGNLSNMREGILNNKQIPRLMRDMAQLAALAPFLEKNEW